MLEFLLDSFGQLEMSKSYNKQTHVRNDDIHTTFSLSPFLWMSLSEVNIFIYDAKLCRGSSEVLVGFQSPSTNTMRRCQKIYPLMNALLLRSSS